MATEHLIPVEQLSTHYQMEVTFINSLHDYGLIEIVTVEQTPYIHEEQLTSLEKLARLHYDLDINLEGIDAIAHILQQMDNMNEELTALRNKLRMYEGE